MFHPRRWGMAERIALVLLGALSLELIGIVALHHWQDRELVSAAQTRDTAIRLAEAVELAETTPPRDRAAGVRRLSFSNTSYNWVPQTVITDSSGILAPLIGMRERLQAYAPALAERAVSLSILPSDDEAMRDLLGTVTLGDGSLISFRVAGYMATPPRLLTIVLLHLLLTAAILAAAIATVRTLVRPLRDLALAADATGRNQTTRIVPAGSHEVKRVATAFAAMQARLLKIMEENTQALIAVSHDLRTPVQRMQLRAGLLADPHLRDQMTGDLLEIERFIQSTLDYVRSGEDEPLRLIDLAALANTAVDDARDAGVDVAYAGLETLTVSSRPAAMRRLLDNLIDNGRKFAGRLLVTLDRSPHDGMVAITVEDDGPGIPEELRQQALQPYQRLSAGHDAGKAGLGLGLSLVRRVAHSLDGHVELGVSSLGGLAVKITVPAIAPQH